MRLSNSATSRRKPGKAPNHVRSGQTRRSVLLDCDASGFDGACCGPIQIGEGFTEIGAGPDLTIASGDQVGLTLQDQEDAGGTGLELALLAGILLFGGLSGEAGGFEARTRGRKALEGTSHIGLDCHADLDLYVL